MTPFSTPTLDEITQVCNRIKQVENRMRWIQPDALEFKALEYSRGSLVVKLVLLTEFLTERPENVLELP